jgi:glycerol-3-phosphate acyltransferase PlsY
VEPWSVAAIVLGYFIGSIDFGVILPRLFGVDIYSVGSGNPGTTNVLRTMGRGLAAATLLGDIAKGFSAALLGDLAGGPAIGFAAGFTAVVGHCYPVWHRFRGGKGVATAGGAALWLEPVLGAILIGIWALLVVLTKRASVASLSLAALFIPGLVLFGHRGWSLVWASAIGALVLFRHRGNILRLIAGAEHQIEEKAE